MTFFESGEGWVVSNLEDLLGLTTIVLATTGIDGEPHAASVYFAADAHFNLHFFSDPSSQHGQDLARNPRAAAAFHLESQDWQEIRGVQMRGKVFKTGTGAGWDRAWEVYVRKFPFVTGLKEVVAQNQFYVFMPHWIRLVDNRRGFGYKEEWVRGEGNGPEEVGLPWLRVAQEGEASGTGGDEDA